VTVGSNALGDLKGARSAIRLDGFARIDATVVAEARGLSTATVHEAAGKIGAMPSAIKPIDPEFRLCGPAVTVFSPGGDNLWLHYAICAAAPGDVLIVNCSGQYDHGYWGEVMSTAAAARQLGGLVIDGCVRDGALLADVGLPIFARGLSIKGTAKDPLATGWINAPTRFGELTVDPGDLVIGDRDGVVVVPRALAAQVVVASKRRDADEAEILERLKAGESTLAIYNLN
jgi:4-hydroxy-4-methyl-2-oxoglutarate aldolase